MIRTRPSRRLWQSSFPVYESNRQKKANRPGLEDGPPERGVLLWVGCQAAVTAPLITLT